uniref:CactinC_cactus domain-containing protein n=1 Tax=Panagrellus redivivus TaxID=6233 RepID=A0A7E4W9R6_PANRE
MARTRLDEQYEEKKKLKIQRMREQQAKEMDEHAKLLGDQKPAMLPVKPNNDVDMEEKADVDMADDLEGLNDTEAARSIALKSIKFTLDELLEMDDDVKEQQWSSLTPTQLDAFTRHMYTSGRYSPTLNPESEAMPRIAIINEADDVKELEEKRDVNRHGHKSGNAPMTSEEAAMLNFAKQGMGKEEEVFDDEATLEKQTYLWADKYRPRKPRYFNRVHTGFDWNKYNQTHYDLDNPPPKIVQGYRFYIFYPDLLDITKTPKYTLTACEDDDFAILRFTAGPPYEDIAFKIVNREWEINHKHGFRNQFKDGVFQLWFSFKRYRYRR